MTRFDSARAWREASGNLAANRDVLLALAGVFFMLPWLAFMLLVPEPAIDSGMAPAEAVKAMGAFLRQNGGWLLGLVLVQSAGTLSVLALCGDPARPTVRDAIRRGTIGVLPHLGALLLFAVGFSLVAGLLGALATTGGKGGEMLVGLALNLVLVYATVRLMMIAPVIAVEQNFQPWRVLVRAWRLTRGNFGRVLVFLLLLVLAGQVIMAVVGMVVGGGVGLIAGAEAGRFAEDLASAAMIALFLLTITSALAAIHNQLAGPWSGSAH
jgi:hypothetical protein